MAIGQKIKVTEMGLPFFGRFGKVIGIYGDFIDVQFPSGRKVTYWSYQLVAA